MTPTVIAIMGRPRAGKDTFAALLAQALLLRQVKSVEISSIDCVRGMLRSAGINVDVKTPELRRLLVETGLLLERHCDFRSMAVARAFKQAYRSCTSVAIVQVREHWIVDKWPRLMTDEVTGHHREKCRVVRVLVRAKHTDDVVVGNATDDSPDFAREDLYDEVVRNDGGFTDLFVKADDLADKLTKD